MTLASAAEHWSVPLIRIGNQAVRAAQARNRCLGIPNWYSLNGRLVCDVAPQDAIPPAIQPDEQVQAPARCESPRGS